MTLKPWLATYRDNGIPETVNADAWPSVVHLLEDAMRRYADKPGTAALKTSTTSAPWSMKCASSARSLGQTLRQRPPFPVLSPTRLLGLTDAAL